ncbi:arylesterase [Ferrimonas pelagia]|uniref:Arylesterase n=2 Tax=Ferrimonas pelagia TaxID=1177826 RepID=A0ABP9FE64_9GAMM
MLLLACSPAQLPPLSQDAVVLAFGDSLTAGVGATPGGDYPNQLAELTGLSVVNAGLSGELAVQGKARLPGLLAQVQPDLVLLMSGGNDFLRDRPRAQVRADLAEMIEQAQASGALVVLIGVTEKRLLLRTSAIYHELAQAYPLVLAEDQLTQLLKRARYRSDPIHLNDDGYRQLALSLVQLLEQQGAL